MDRRLVRVVSFVVALCAVAVGFACSAMAGVRESAAREEERQMRALVDAVDRLEDVADALSAAVAAEAPLPALVKLRHAADLAAASLSALPGEGAGLAALRHFAVCTAEIAGASVDDLARGRVRVPDYALLVRLRDAAGPLCARVLPAAIDPAAGTVDDGAIAAHLATLGRLYYDGVGSDVAGVGHYATLTGRDVIDETKARRLAADAVGGTVHLARVEVGGAPVRFCFTGSNLTVVLTADGRLMSLFYDRRREAGEAVEAAIVEAAARMMAKHAPEAMVAVERARGEVCDYFTYAPMRDGLLCLSERVLVGVDRATARVCLFDADGYYRYHTQARAMPSELIDAEAAKRICGGGDAVLCTALRRDGRELICWRVGDRFVNAVTGRVEDVQ